MDNKNKLNIVFRIDGNNKIGFGNVKRCLVLADEFVRIRHAKITFVFKDSPFVEDLLRKKRYAIVIIKGKEFVENEINAIPSSDILITDSPLIKASFLSEVKKRTKCLVSIDDVNNTFFPGDVLFNPCMQNKTVPRFSKKTKYFHGLKYALIDRRYQKNYKNERKNRNIVREILICFGGSDPHNISQKVIRGIYDILLSRGIHATLILGPMFKQSNFQRINHADYKRSNVSVIYGSNSMPKLLSAADVAIISGGTLMYEAAIVGVPSLIINQNIEQANEAQSFHRVGAAINLGLFNDFNLDYFRKKFLWLIDNSSLRNKIVRKAKGIIDPYGAQKIVGEILKISKKVVVR